MTKKYGVTLFGIVLFLLAVNSTAWAPTNWFGRLLYGDKEKEAPKLDPATQELLTKYEEYVRFSMGEENIPGAAVAIVKGGRVIFEKGFGVKASAIQRFYQYGYCFQVGLVVQRFCPRFGGHAGRRRLPGMGRQSAGLRTQLRAAQPEPNPANQYAAPA
ncbi:MAG: hypothetical protein IPN33_22245 [Saprospiraceae bacterium]|nr:hypothetical protein [Saprospiraceae bacterium]